MDRVPGHAWLMILAAAVLVLVASAGPLAPVDNEAVTAVVSQGVSLVGDYSPDVNLWGVAGS